MSKKEKIGTTSIHEKTLFSVTNDSNNTLEERNWAFWEILREKPEYLELCEDIKFHNSGVVSPRWMIENMEKFLKKSKRAKELLGIETIVDPSKSQHDLQPDIIHLFGVAPVPITAISSVNSDSDKNNRFIEDNRYVTLKVDFTAKDNLLIPLLKEFLEFFRERNSDVDNGPSNSAKNTTPEKNNSFLEDKRYVTLKFDFTAKNNILIPLFKEYLTFFREQNSVSQYNPTSKREHHSKQRQYTKICRERKNKTPFSIIAKQEGISVETAKKGYYRAYELIMGFPYSPDNKVKDEIHKIELQKTCDSCTDQKCLESLDKESGEWTCPYAEHYFNQDQRPMKEHLQASNSKLYSIGSGSKDD